MCCCCCCCCGGVICPALAQSQGSDPGTADAPWDQPQFGCCCQCQQKRWLEQWVLTVPQAPGPEGSLGWGWEGAAPCSPSAPHRAGLGTSGAANREPASLFQPCLLRVWPLELQVDKGSCSWSLHVSPCSAVLLHQSVPSNRKKPLPCRPGAAGLCLSSSARGKELLRTGIRSKGRSFLRTCFLL